MAKIRRVIRKRQPANDASFDERLWPVNVALLVLASFLTGMALAYLDPEDARWWANRWTWLIVIPAWTIGMMVALRMVSHRALRRAVQFAAVLSVIVHVVLLIVSLQSTIFSGDKKQPVAKRDLVDTTPKATLPEYAQHHFDDPQQRPQQDYERPVETKTPEAKTQEIARQETQPTQPREAQPTPVPESQPTQTPNIVQRQQAGETAPRASDQASKLSRRLAPPVVQPNQLADAPSSTPAASAATPARQEPTPTPTESRPTPRQTTRAQIQPAAPPIDVPPTQSTTPAAVARRSPEVAKLPDSTSAPTRVRRSRGSDERQTAQPHPTCGTPNDVPVPRKVSLTPSPP